MAFSSLFRRKSTTTILQQGGDGDHTELHKVLTVRDLTFFGIAAIIGGGTFSAIGNACFSGGPGVVSFVLSPVDLPLCAMLNLLHVSQFLEVHIPMLMSLLGNYLHGLSDGL